MTETGNASKENEQKAPGIYNPGINPESVPSVIIQIAVFALVVTGALAWYYSYVSELKRVAELFAKAREVQAGGDATAFLEARKYYIETGKIEDDDSLLAHMGEVTALLYGVYGMDDLAGEAGDYLSLMRSRDLRKAERYAAEAYYYLGQGRSNPEAYGQAESVITAITSQGIRHGKILHALSLSVLGQGRPAEAQRAAEEGMKLATGLVRLPIAQGDALLAQENYGSARASYAKALATNGQHIWARTAIQLTDAITREGKPALLLRECDKLLRELETLHPENPPVRTKAFILSTKGEVFFVDGQSEAALKSANDSLALFPFNDRAHLLKGRALARLGKNDEAKAAFAEATKLSPKSLDVAKQIAWYMNYMEDKEGALAVLEAVKTANEEESLVYPELVKAYIALEKVDEAKAAAEETIKRLGDAHELGNLSMARVHIAKKEADEAKAQLVEAHTNKGKPWAELTVELARFGALGGDKLGAANTFVEVIKLYEKENAPVEQMYEAYTRAATAMKAVGLWAQLQKSKELEAEAKLLWEKAPEAPAAATP
ncbi:MAG: hypothetical protein CMH56_15795 [Myxococcales bacterium]|nr:hypothetical protein [Myxococcales bacterium]